MSEPVTSLHPIADLGPAGWADLVARVQADDPAGMEELYRIFAGGIRFYLYRQLGAQDIEDKVHDVFLVIVQSLRRGDLREPERLMGYVRTVVRRHVATRIEEIVRARNGHAELEVGMVLADRRPDPERSAIQKQNKALAMRILRNMHERERDVLTRFYLHEQSPAEICRDLELSANQFRLIKSRAKTRYVELAKSRFSLRRLFLNATQTHKSG